MIKLIEYLQARMKTVVMVCIVLLICIAAFAAAVDKHHAHTWVEQNIPFFWSIFGFCAAAALIGLPAGLVRPVSSNLMIITKNQSGLMIQTSKAKYTHSVQVRKSQ